ncbi:glyoxylate reductase [Paucidesulfovibrio gracilis DSM 16080]|jgi:glyoxylate reductase|uniref:Glyoxylate reductase n=1 Tax=Paucidesulfovibrio gracilis DSM 16080 TaxID=1121449 RepID=A0A1T4XX61_9BACT|nr:D-glycerate dehydrogenase [Paucidesulfovibrio gracilis]SKA94127.1 glyoxylate reductase [Paucidesulfovibrio gracilis DSM 16080]
MSLPKVVITRPLPEAGLSQLREQVQLVENKKDRPMQRTELLEAVQDAHGVIGLLTDRIDAEFFDAAPKLVGYANYAVGYDNIDVTEATRRGIPVSNTPDVLTRATAELAWGLLFAVARRIVETDGVMRSGHWPGWGPMQYMGMDVSGRTLGIVGAGRIGTAMALMSRGFDMPVLYLESPSGRRNQILESKVNAQCVSWEELLQRSDFVSVHCPLTPATRHLFDRRAFRKMKNSAILINTARGPVIKEDDLVAALREGDIAGAGLDVYEKEPVMADGLAALQQAVLLPHVGSATHTTREAMAELAARNLLAMLHGTVPPTCLNPEVLA